MSQERKALNSTAISVMLLLTAEVAEEVGLGFHIDNYYSAGIGAVIVTIVGWVADIALHRAVREGVRRLRDGRGAQQRHVHHPGVGLGPLELGG